MVERRLSHWIVEDMVATLTRDPDICLVLNPEMVPKTGMPRVVRDGKRYLLHRYLLFRHSGREPREALLAACPTPGCLNPYHFERSMRRSRKIVTHCPNGHEYEPHNVVKGQRYKCLICHEMNKARRRKGEFGQGYCPRGHRHTKTNTYITRRDDGTTRKRCRKCALETQRRYRERKARADD